MISDILIRLKVCTLCAEVIASINANLNDKNLKFNRSFGLSKYTITWLASHDAINDFVGTVGAIL